MIGMWWAACTAITVMWLRSEKHCVCVGRCFGGVLCTDCVDRRLNFFFVEVTDTVLKYCFVL